MKSRILVLIVSVISFFVASVFLVNQFPRAYAWESPQLSANCAPDESNYSFTIFLQPGEPNYVIDFNWDSTWTNNHTAPPVLTTDFGSAGSHDFVIGRAGSILWVRYRDDTSAVTSQSVNGGLCVTPTPTPVPSVAPTGTPAPTATPTETPSTSTGGGSTSGGGSANPPSCPDQKPNQPYNLLAVAGPGSGQVTLTWGPPSGPVSDYSIVYSDDPSTQKWGVVSTGNVTKYVISDLQITKYYFWVAAVNGCMPGDLVGPVSVGGIGGPVTGPAVLGLSTTSGGQNIFLAFTQLLGAFWMTLNGLRYFKKNA